MYLIFDTETTGLPSRFKSAGDDNQARVLQIAAMQLDEQFKPIAALKTLIKPDGWRSIDPGAQAAHGIDFDMCVKYGVACQDVLSTIEQWSKQCSMLIAHNIKFDQQMLDIECTYHKRTIFVVENIKHKLFCTMLHSTDICKIPHPKWPNRFKWPKVKEAYAHFFGVEPADQHDAFGDVAATAKIFKKLWEYGIVPKVLAS